MDMLTISALIFLGLLLISAELLVPGGILGTIGVLALVGACYFTFQAYGLYAAVILALLLTVMSAVVIYLEFKLLKKTRWGQRIFLRTSSGGPSLAERAAAQVPEALVGKTGETLTTLAPSGKVLVDGQVYEAYSRSGLLRTGETVEVIGRDAFRLVVKKP